MDKDKLINKLMKKTNISYEEARLVLENNNWDILDAVVSLEEQGRANKPFVSTFYTNEVYSEEKNELVTVEEKKYNYDRNFYGFFEGLCNLIDTCNNIFVEIKKNNKTMLKIPFTVVIILLFFMFWVVVPIVVLGLFLDIELYLYSKKVNTDKANNILSKISKYVKKLKGKSKKVNKND